MFLIGQPDKMQLSTSYQSRGHQMLLASYKKQGLTVPNLVLGKAATTKPHDVYDYDAVSSSTAGFSWKISKWQQGLPLEQLLSYSGSEAMSQELPILKDASPKETEEATETSFFFNEDIGVADVDAEPLEAETVVDNSLETTTNTSALRSQAQLSFPLDGFFTGYVSFPYVLLVKKLRMILLVQQTF